MRRFIVSIILGTVIMSAHRDCLAAGDSRTPRQTAAVTPSLSLTPTAGIFLFDSHSKLEASPIYGLRLGYDIIGRNAIDSLGVEAGLSVATTRSKANKSAVKAYLLRTEALYSVLPRERFVPSFAVGAGGMYADGGNSSLNAFIDYGASLKYFIKDYLALRFDVRHIFVYDNMVARSNIESTLGLSFFPSYDKELKRVPPVDSDKDGVPDYLDKCPNTPKGVKVDRDGCPVDSDGDGVPDYLDKCPGTPVGVKVDRDGCPLDSNGNGVPDYLNKCPGTPVGVKVDKDGCPAKSTEPAVIGAAPPTSTGTGTGEPAKAAAPAPKEAPATPPANPPRAVGASAAMTDCITKLNGVTLLDSDCDGIPDYLDKCPGTPWGVTVDKDGCPTGIAAPVTSTVTAPAMTIPAPTVQAPTAQVPATKVPKTKVPTTQVPTPPAPEDQAPAAPTPAVPTPAIRVPTDQVPASQVPTALAPATPAAPLPSVPPVVSTHVAPTPEKPGVEPEAAPIEPAPIVIEVPIKSLLPRKGMSSTGYFTSAVDRCPPTHESRIVYDEKQLLKLVINFRTDKADIDQKYFKKFKEISEFMKNNPDAQAHVEGHADYTGPFDYNITLSRIRAINIKNQILNNGNIDPERISINAYGCSIPIVDNKTTEGRRKNRRGVTVITLTVTGPTVIAPHKKVSAHEKAEPVHAPTEPVQAPTEPVRTSTEPAPIPVEVATKPIPPRKGMSSTGYFTAAVDRCPPIPESKIVYDEKPLMKLVINFRVDKADIDQKYFKKIVEIYDFMKKNPTVFAHVEGHADYTGPFDYNMTLSRARAINIKNQILHNGDIDPERISINAYGCSIPIADNRTTEGRRKNRRGVTVITLTETGPSVAK